jgi:ABC-2 type transport system ATP-binding protein
MGSAIRPERVSKNLGKRQVLNDISFAVEAGDIFGYLGHNGAGKTTTIRVMLGLFTPDSGGAYILGGNARNNSDRENVGFVLETDGLYDNLTDSENLDYYCQLYSLPQALRGKRIDKMLELVKLTDRAKDKVSAYSRGMRQKLTLAQAMLHDPELLILDKPTAGVDSSGQMTEEESRILDGLMSRLESLSYVAGCRREDQKLHLQLSGQPDVSEIVATLSREHIGVEEVTRSKASLEEIYASAIEGER